jgi:plastocyanin
MLRRLVVIASLSCCPVLFAVAPARAGGGCTEVTSGRSANVDLKGFCIFPTLIRVPAGTEVTFANRDSVPHVIVGAGFAWGSVEKMQPGDSFSTTFARDGVYPFQCYIHPGMSGAVLVGDANARGAATTGGVVVPPSAGDGVAEASPAAVTPALVSPAAVSGRVAESSGIRWPVVLLIALGGVLIAAALGFARFRSRSTPARPPAAT